MLSQYMSICIAESQNPNIFDNLDEEVWSFARKHEHIPDLDRIYCVVVCSKLENLVKENYPTANVNYYIDDLNIHFFVDYQEVKNVTEYKIIIGDFIQKQAVQWIPELYLKLSNESGIGVKIVKDKVQYAFAQSYRFGNVQETKLLEENAGKDGTSIKYFVTNNVGQKIQLADFKPFNQEKYKKSVQKDVETNAVRLSDEKEALYNTLEYKE